MPDTLAFGLFDLNIGACSEPETASRIARLAEGVGFESLWAGEHVVLPDPREPPSPMEPRDRILDPVIALAFLAAQTRRVRLGTGIILPQRNPLVLAKEIGSPRRLVNVPCDMWFGRKINLYIWYLITRRRGEPALVARKRATGSVTLCIFARC